MIPLKQLVMFGSTLMIYKPDMVKNRTPNFYELIKSSDEANFDLAKKSQMKSSISVFHVIDIPSLSQPHMS